MHSLLAPLGLGAAVFALTNMDDMLVLLGFFAHPKFRPWQIVSGQFAGIAVLYFVSMAASLMSRVVPLTYIGLLGVAPILIGTTKLLERPGRPDSVAGPQSWAGATSARKVAIVAAVTVANGGDNIASYTPLFAAHTGQEVALMGAVFVAMTGLWCVIAQRLIGHSGFGSALRRNGRRILPVILIGLGILILWKTDTIALLGSG